MDIIGLLLLMLSIILTSGRNILSKGVSASKIGTRSFFLIQLIIFGTGSIALLCFGGVFSTSISPLTVAYALIYGGMLLCAQWCYTTALRNGKTAVCSTVYSMGFIFPTLSGAIFWNESLTVWKVLGIITVIPAIILSGLPSGKKGSLQSTQGSKNSYIIPLIISMVASGGLGIMQKVQQSSPYPKEKSSFVLIAFLFASLVSFVCFLLCKPENNSTVQRQPKKFFAAAGVGACFSICNMLNTTLAGRLDSAIFFPTLNVGAILLSMLLGILIYKERLTKKDLAVLLFGLSAVIMINLKI